MPIQRFPNCLFSGGYSEEINLQCVYVFIVSFSIDLQMNCLMWGCAMKPSQLLNEINIAGVSMYMNVT